MPKISKVAIGALLTRLSDPATGFNRNLELVADSYGIKPWAVDWDPDASVNFMIGQVLPDLIEESSSFTYPYITIDTAGALDDSRVVSAVFAGTIPLIVDVHLSLVGEDFPRALNPLAQAVEDAMFQTLNSLEDIGVYMTAGLTYNGRWSLQKSSIQFAGQNWRRSLRFSNSVGFITN
jgi:hypothetical protein